MPDKRATPAEWSVIAGTAVAALVVAGLLALWYSFRAPANQAGVAGELRLLGLGLGSLALSVCGVWWLIRRMV